MLPSLPAATWSSAELSAVATAMIAPQEANPTTGADPEENTDIEAGFTYFGQFVDHDLTLDARPDDLTTPVDPSKLTNGRTPQLDLDNVYGSGPSGSPALYESDRFHLRVGARLTGTVDTGARDLPRDANGQAAIGDPRDDENRIVGGIHASFLRLHNTFADRVRAERPSASADEVLAVARQRTTAVYQRIILDEYLPRIVDRRTLDDVIRPTTTGWTTNLRFYRSCQQMPVEFAGAAYRFGHSQVRAAYKINEATPALQVFAGTFAPGSDLAGFQPAPSTFAIDWSRFLRGSRASSASSRLQLSYRIDPSLTFSLSLLPLPATGSGPANLALRNLLRGQQLGLPSGQSVARALGITPLTGEQLLLGKATDEAGASRPLSQLAPSMSNSTPLWLYVLAEATANAFPIRNGRVVGPQKAPFTLGPVGSRIVAETVVGLLASDPSSIVSQGAPVGGARLALHDVVDGWTPPASNPPPSTTAPSTTRAPATTSPGTSPLPGAPVPGASLPPRGPRPRGL